MISSERRKWAVVGVVFLAMFLVGASTYVTAPVFFSPLLAYFHWSRARVSSLQTTTNIASGLSAPLLGYLFDVAPAQLLMGGGAILAALGMLIASHAFNYPTMIGAFVSVGVGLAASCTVGCPFVIANWFREKRGIAMGLGMAGVSVGGMVVIIVANRLIANFGWRTSYLLLALPMIFVVLPLILIFVRTRPKELVGGRPRSEIVASLPGYTLQEGLRQPTLYLICLVYMCFGFSISGCLLHTIPYLIRIGYTAGGAAKIFGTVVGVTTIGKVTLGHLADRITGRRALALTLAMTSIGVFLLLGAASLPMLLLYMTFYGLSAGATQVLVPVVVAESMGLKAYGSFSGLSGFFYTVGASCGPVTAGMIFDANHSYSDAYKLFATVFFVGAMLTLACKPLPVEATELKLSRLHA